MSEQPPRASTAELAPDAVVPGHKPQISLKKWQIIGPGLVVAGTGVGAADLVATLTAGSRYGYALLWAVIVGVILKIVLVEGAGRYSLATGRTIFQGWRSLGRWTTWYFAPYIVIWGVVYGASAMTSAALPLVTLFPGIDLKLAAFASGLIGFAMVWFGRYRTFEKIVSALVLIMMVTVVGISTLALPNLGEIARGLVPLIPDGSMIYVLGLAGGVGGTITLAAYGYWLREKGWASAGWMRVMRLDNTVAYVVTGIFVVAVMIMGVELLYSANLAISSGDNGLIDLSEILRERYGDVIGILFLVGFWAASFSSLVGVWNGVSLMFADFVGNLKGLPGDHPDVHTGGKYFKWYVVWLTFPPMLLFFLEQPTGLVIAYGALGALFMPFLALTLLLILNSSRTPKEWRNGWLSNALMGICTLLFLALGVNQLISAFSG